MIANILHSLSIALGYDEPKRPTHETFPKQREVGRISAPEIRSILELKTNIELKTSFQNADTSYKLVDIDNLKLFVAKNNLSRLVYEPEKLDCDDFSFILQGDISRWDSDLAFGIVWGVTPQGQGHAWNMCIGTDLNLWFIEPQTNTVFKPKDLWKITLLIM